MESGRKEWREKFAKAGPPPTRTSRYRRNRGSNGGAAAALSMAAANAESLGGFKTSPAVAPRSCRPRPFMGRCCACMPASRADGYHDKLQDRGLHNIFNVESDTKGGGGGGVLSRTFKHLAHTLRRRVDHVYPDVSLAVLASPRLTEAVHQAAADKCSDPSAPEEEEEKQRRKEEQKYARVVVRRMRATISNTLIRLTGWFLHKFLGSLLSSIVVHRGQLDMITKLHQQRREPVILLPTHRSHLDYILVTFILYNIDLQAPHVAAGENLIMPVFGQLMRGLGGYFIRRKMDKHGKKDTVYRAALHSYMEELLRRNENFEFFIEGGRTRSGKALIPKGGLLSVIVDAYIEGVIPDAQLVPVSISYDKLLEGNFNNEQMGKPKVKETFWHACLSIWRVLMGHYGSVRVDFSQPFSLKEYLQVANTFPNSLPALEDSPQPSINGSMNGAATGSATDSAAGSVNVPHRGSNHSLYGTDCVVEDMRNTIQGLAEHVIYASVRSQSLMSTQLLAFLLLHKYRQGGPLSRVAATFEWLAQEARARRRDLGFQAGAAAALDHALDLHGHLVHTTRGEDGTTFITPKTGLPDVFDLAYHANVVTSVFAVESVIANALHVCGEVPGPGGEGELTVSRQEVLSAAARLCRLLRYEFVFAPTCTPLKDVLQDGLDRFLAAEIIASQEEVRVRHDPREEEWMDRFTRSFRRTHQDSDSDEDGMVNDTIYKVNRKCALSAERLAFLRGVLAPVLEGYYVLSCHLPLLEHSPMPESKFTSLVHQQLIDRVKKGIATYNESAALDTVKNGLHGLRYTRVIESRPGDSGVIELSLRDNYRGEKLTEFIASLEAYRS